MYRLLFILLMSLIFTQEPCKGTCLSEEETKNLFNNIKELEFNLNKCNELNSNLTLQITDYEKLIESNKLLIEDYKLQIELKDDMIQVVKPKWYENKYIWFGLGVVFTSGGVYLAGQL
tara:strand:- start:364 stop:717 length:354 start_codon:yes stop_codon:yes gene_type:complete